MSLCQRQETCANWQPRRGGYLKMGRIEDKARGGGGAGGEGAGQDAQN